MNEEYENLKDSDLKYFRDWFRGFCSAYYRDDCKEQMNILLKEKHSLLVAENALIIAKGETFESNELMIAEMAGLFHDIGRFPQYARYKTFLDRISVNHGQLGAETLLAEGILSCLSEKERDIIVNAVRFHNAFALPENMDKDTVHFTKVVRDADKIDIWRVFCEYYEESDEDRADAVPLGLPDLPTLSKEAITTINSRQVITLAHVRTVNDLKLLQLSWVFDLNFRSSFRFVQEQGSISRMAGLLPGTDDVAKAVATVQDYVSEMAV
jgi:HD superfamily phosphohydrolase YqeK